MVITGTSPNSSEAGRKSILESWGHTVTTIQDSASQAAYDAATASVDVAYMSGTIDDWELLYKLRTATCGVITERPGLDTEMGFTTSDGYTENATQIFNVVNTHAVTAGLPSGTVALFSTSQQFAPNGNTLAAGLLKLGERNSGMLGLGVMEKGATLANTYNGNSTASGRRVRLPWANITASTNSYGTILMQNAINWAGSGATSLIGHWKLDEGSGTVADDASTSGYDGTYAQGPTLGARGARADAATFDGVNDRVELPAIETTASALTISAWIKASDFTSPAGRIIAKANGTSQSNNYWTLTTYESGGSHYLGLLLKTDSAGTVWIADANDPLPVDEWVLVTAVYNGSTVTHYQNVQAVHSGSVSGAVTGGSGVNVWIGGSPANEKFFRGEIDDVRVYDYAISQSELYKLYGLVAHWKLDETSGTVADDATPLGHDASLTGTQNWGSGVDSGGHAFDYNNGEDYFTAPTNDLLNNVQEDDYTLMAYFKPANVPPSTVDDDNHSAYGIVRKAGWHMGLL
ncbi:MAG: LamG domain-containing protein, partial [Planctomycetales bacterium]|nr:LamG domain-containing protein [Planctomycetales bacterium]